MNITDVVVLKKDGTKQNFDPDKIIAAVEKSAYRALSPLTDKNKEDILAYVEDYIQNYQREEITVPQMHNLVESALERIKPEVAKSYRDYRNYKTDFVEMINGIYKKAQSIMYIGDKENSNTDSALVSTKRSLIFNQLNKELYQKFFMTTEELQACREGYIYIHDMSARRDTMNCFRRDTKFITVNGVKSFENYKDGDVVTVYTHLGHKARAVVHSYGNQIVNKITFTNGEENRIVYATANHRWILANGNVTTSLNLLDRLWRYNGNSWMVFDIELGSNTPEEVWCLEVEEEHSFILDGDIPTGNCCLSDIKTILKDGFEMGNIWYNEPKSLDTVFDVIGDVVLSAASQQYGGFTTVRVDELLAPYAEMSYNRYYQEKYDEIIKLGESMTSMVGNIQERKNIHEELEERAKKEAENYANAKIYRDFEQGFQGWEYKFNTVSSSRGDYPFTTITVGLGTKKFEKMATTACLRVRANGQGKEGRKHPVLFPKIVFTYTEDLHGEGKPNEDLFWEGIKCSSKAMYPDWLSLDGDTSVGEMYHKYGEVIAPINITCGI